jgi:hypothetical protein
VGNPQADRTRPYDGFGPLSAFVILPSSFPPRWLCWRFQLACRWLCTPSVQYPYTMRTPSVHHINGLAGGFEVACEWLQPAFAILHSAFCILPWLRHGSGPNPRRRLLEGRRSKVKGRGLKFAAGCWMSDVGCFSLLDKSPEYSPPPALPSGWSGGTLDKPWTCPGTAEPAQTTVFDQPHLSSSLHPPLRRRLCVLAPTVLCRRLPGAAQVRTRCVSRNNLWLRRLRGVFGFCAVFGGMGGVASPTARPFFHSLTVVTP